MRIEQLRKEFGLSIQWRVFPLHPDTPDAGMSLHDLFSGQLDIESMLSRLKGVASELGLPFGERTQTYNSRRAQELGKWAEDSGQGEAYHAAVYRAYFVDGANIADPEVLAGISSSLGLDKEIALQILNGRRYAAAVDSDWQRAGDLGVSAVPTVLYRDQRLVGFQPYEKFRRLMID